MRKNKNDRLIQAIVCSPKYEYFHINHLGKHNITAHPDKEKAIMQHSKLKQTLQQFGCDVVDIAELKGHPNSVFVKDTAVCTPKGYIKPRMGLPSRRREEEWISKELESLNLPLIASLEAPATLEGGDVILAGKVAFVGHSSRTNEEGVRQIRRILKDIGYEVRVTDVPAPFLHLGGAMSVVSHNSVIHCKHIFPKDFFKGFKEIKVPCSTFIGGNVINLGEGRVIVEASNTTVIEILKKEGFDTQLIDLSEFIKGTGGPSCLILPVRREG